MKPCLIFVLSSLFLPSCTKQILEKDRRQIYGDWKVNISYFMADDKRVFKRTSPNGYERIRFEKPNRFELIKATDTMRGMFRMTAQELHFDVYEDTALVQQFIWFYTSIQPRVLSHRTVEGNGTMELYWRKIKE